MKRLQRVGRVPSLSLFSIYYFFFSIRERERRKRPQKVTMSSIEVVSARRGEETDGRQSRQHTHSNRGSMAKSSLPFKQRIKVCFRMGGKEGLAVLANKRTKTAKKSFFCCLFFKSYKKIHPLYAPFGMANS